MTKLILLGATTIALGLTGCTDRSQPITGDANNSSAAAPTGATGTTNTGSSLESQSGTGTTSTAPMDSTSGTSTADPNATTTGGSMGSAPSAAASPAPTPMAK